MTTWIKNQGSASLRRCVLNVAASADGQPAPASTDLTGKVFFRSGGDGFIAASGTVTNIRRPLVQADDTFTADAGTDVVTFAVQDPATGSGPFTLTTSNTLPGGLALLTEYWWIRTGPNTGKFAESLQDAFDGTEVDISSAGTGTHTISDTEDTQQPIDGRWLYQATQGETNVAVNEVEIAVIDDTWYAQTLVRIATLDEYAEAVWDEVMETASEGDVTFGDAMRGLASFAFGKVANFSTGVLSFRNLADTKTRFTSTLTAGFGRAAKVLNDLLP